MVVRTDATKNEVLEPITFVLAYPTVFDRCHYSSKCAHVCYGVDSSKKKLSVELNTVFLKYKFLLIKTN